MFEIPYSNDFVLSHDTTIESTRALKGVVQRDMGNGYCWYHLPIRIVAGAEVGVSLCFNGVNLFSIKLALQDYSRYGNSWATFSEDQETRRAHDTIDWLSTLGLRIGDYAWGSISGGFDPKSASGCAHIHIKKAANKTLHPTAGNAPV